MTLYPLLPPVFPPPSVAQQITAGRLVAPIEMGIRKKSIVLLALMMLAGTCKKEGPDCHHDVTFKNASSDTLIFAYRAYHEGGCNLQGPRLAPMGSYINGSRTCWEDDLAGSGPYEIYVVSVSGYNDPIVYYSCDSITARNDVLAMHVLTVEYLRSTDFTVTYP